MPAEKHVALLKEAYREWERSRGENGDCWLSILDDNVTLRSLSDGRPGMEFTRQRHSKIDVASYLAGLTADWEMLSWRVEEYIAQNDRVAVLANCAWRNKRTNKSIETPIVHLWRFKNLKITEFFEFYDTATAQAAAV